MVNFYILKINFFLYPKIILLKLGYLNFLGQRNRIDGLLMKFLSIRKRLFCRFSDYKWIIKNNTYVLEKFYNWKGIAIEPNRFSQLVKIEIVYVLIKLFPKKKLKLNF